MVAQLLYNGKLLLYPKEGDLLVISDLHGNWQDFQRIVEIFQQLRRSSPKVYLLFLGDLVHGPSWTPHWPSDKGWQYYPDESDRILDTFVELQRGYSGYVHSLLGNHEHSHVGGPYTKKFHPNEREYLENRLGPRKAREVSQMLRHWPLIALAPSGIVFTHGAPRARMGKLEDLHRVKYEDCSHLSPKYMPHLPILGELLWSRSATEREVVNFFQVFSPLTAVKLAIFGHVVRKSGYEKRPPYQMVLSSSFAVPKENRCYLHLKLQNEYDLSSLREGKEICKLYEE